MKKTPSPTSDSQQSPDAPSAHDMLGAKLKAYYSEIINEPIPDRLLALMAELEAESTKKDAKTGFPPSSLPPEDDKNNGEDI